MLQSRVTEQLLAGGKIVLIYGARQVGKTTLVHEVLGHLPYQTLVVNADEIRYADVLASRDLRRLRGLVEGYELLFVDEAQRIPEIGVNLKLLIDHLPQLRMVVKGYKDEQDRTKHAAAHRWGEAVSNWGQMGRWVFDHCAGPGRVKAVLAGRT